MSAVKVVVNDMRWTEKDVYMTDVLIPDRQAAGGYTHIVSYYNFATMTTMSIVEGKEGKVKPIYVKDEELWVDRSIPTKMKRGMPMEYKTEPKSLSPSIKKHFDSWLARQIVG